MHAGNRDDDGERTLRSLPVFPTSCTLLNPESLCASAHSLAGHDQEKNIPMPPFDIGDSSCFLAQDGTRFKD